MTDTSDLKALPKITLEDLLIRCTDYDDMSLSMDASELEMLKQHISLLEAERQRVAEITEQYVDRTTALSFATQRAEAAEKSNAFLKAELAKLANFNPDWDMLEACRESWREVVALLKEREAELLAIKSSHSNMVTRCALLRQRTDLPVDRLPAYNALVKAQEEIALLKAQLLNPVVLPAGYSTRNGHPFHEGERNVMIPNKHGDWLSRFDVEHALRVADFKVQCGETTQQKPVISKEKLCDWLEDNFDIDDSQRDAFANCFAHHCNCIVKDVD